MTYSKIDFSLLTHPYFHLIRMERGCCEFQSENTKHFWKLVDVPGGIRLYHKYSDSLNYHIQTHFGTIEDALLTIALHDDYILYGRQHALYTKGTETFFDYILAQYSQNRD